MEKNATTWILLLAPLIFLFVLAMSLKVRDLRRHLRLRRQLRNRDKALRASRSRAAHAWTFRPHAPPAMGDDRHDSAADSLRS
ncbi:MAG: hypothetical protein ABFS23_00065 [Pseudomonadota bacterium]